MLHLCVCVCMCVGRSRCGLLFLLLFFVLFVCECVPYMCILRTVELVIIVDGKLLSYLVGRIPITGRFFAVLFILYRGTRKRVGMYARSDENR